MTAENELASVNELAVDWKCLEDHRNAGECADDLTALARAAWKPVSEPPTEADGDDRGLVLVRVPEDEESAQALMVWPWADIAQSADEPEMGIRWARIRDAVLLPPEGEGE